MPEVFDGENWETMAEGARRIGVEYNVVANYIHYHHGLDSRTVGTSRFVKSSELDAKAPAIREYGATRQKRKRRVPA